MNPYRVTGLIEGTSFLVGITDHWKDDIKEELRSVSGAKLYVEGTPTEVQSLLWIVAGTLEEFDFERREEGGLKLANGKLQTGKSKVADCMIVTTSVLVTSNV